MQYHGGTNFERTGSAFVITAYYDQAPLDEYGVFLISLLKLKNFIIQKSLKPLDILL